MFHSIYHLKTFDFDDIGGKLGELHVTHPTGEDHTATLIFFHGELSSGEEMKEWVRLNLSNFSFPHIKILYPTAPLQRYTPSYNQMSRIWFNRIGICPTAHEQIPSIFKIEATVMNLIRKEHQYGIPSNRIIVGGFSMGGSLALHAAYRWDRNLAGAFAISSYLNHDSLVYQDLKDEPDDELPEFLQFHGDKDDVNDFTWGHSTFYRLRALDVPGEFNIMRHLEHKIDTRVMIKIKNWASILLPDV